MIYVEKRSRNEQVLPVDTKDRTLIEECEKTTQTRSSTLNELFPSNQ